MTVGGDFIPTNSTDLGDGPSYPQLFGLTLTPKVNGIIIAAVGLLGSLYLGTKLIQPAWQQNQTLQQDIATKQSQLVDQAETQRQIREAQERLRQANQLQADVLALFANRKNLDTLLIDLNERIQAQAATRSERASLLKFESTTPKPEIVADSSLGSAVNGVLGRQVFNVEMEGSFAQTQSIIRNIERLQPLLVVKGLKSNLDSESKTLVIDQRGRVLSASQPEPRIYTSFQLIAILPASELQAPAAAPTPGTPPATPTAAASPAPAAAPSPAAK